MLRRYENIKDLMELEQEMKDLVRKHGNPAKVGEIHKVYVRKIRDELKRIDRNFTDPLEKPLTEKWRTQVDDEYGEDGKDYRILVVEDPDDWTDEEIEEYIMDAVGYPPINSPYDCTGKRFTAWTSWSRQPVGIVMIHIWGLDV